jgi:hypothetical protein
LRLLVLTFTVTIGVFMAAVGAHAAAKSQVIRFVAVQVSQKATKGGFVIRDNDFINGKRVGRDTLTCSSASQTKANCGLVVALPGGTIKARFVIVFSKSRGQGTIIGGTGKYAGAKGTLTFANLNAKGTRTAVVLTLV